MFIRFVILTISTLLFAACASLSSQDTVASEAPQTSSISSEHALNITSESGAEPSEQAIEQIVYYYRGFTPEQSQRLKDQQELYGNLSSQELQIASFNGLIDCTSFIHLEWECFISSDMIVKVGVNAFEAWVQPKEKTGACINIYNFPGQFGLTLEELISMNEKYEDINMFDVETARRRFRFIHYQGLSQQQWQYLKDQEAWYYALPEEERQKLTNDDISCSSFQHLYWEHLITTGLINRIGGEAVLAAWLKEQPDLPSCGPTIYDIAKGFDLTLEELREYTKSFEKAGNDIPVNNMALLYDLETLLQRYDYYTNWEEGLY